MEIEIVTFSVKCTADRPEPIDRSDSKEEAEVLFSVVSLISKSAGYIWLRLFLKSRLLIDTT